SHFFAEAHPYWQQRVVVIGGGNSAVEAALEVHRVGARVTLVHFQGEFDRGVKPWILPDVTNRVKDGSIAVRWCSRVIEIRRSEVVIRSEVDDRLETLSTDFVLALTGYRADLRLLRLSGVDVDETTGVPHHDPTTMETNGRGAQQNAPRSVTRAWGRCHPPAAGLSHSLRPLGFAPRRRRRFALNRDVLACRGGKNGAPGAGAITASLSLHRGNFVCRRTRYLMHNAS